MRHFKPDLDSIPKDVRQIVLHVASLAHASLTLSRAWAADSPFRRVRLAVERLAFNQKPPCRAGRRRPPFARLRICL